MVLEAGAVEVANEDAAAAQPLAHLDAARAIEAAQQEVRLRRPRVDPAGCSQRLGEGVPLTRDRAGALIEERAELMAKLQSRSAQGGCSPNAIWANDGGRGA